ncbi:hypothetical protein J6590_096260, partial [Homalodisca vitripennis]
TINSGMRYDPPREEIREVVYQTTRDKGYALKSLGKGTIHSHFLSHQCYTLAFTKRDNSSYTLKPLVL